MVATLDERGEGDCVTVSAGQVVPLNGKCE